MDDPRFTDARVRLKLRTTPFVNRGPDFRIGDLPKFMSFCCFAQGDMSVLRDSFAEA